MDEAREATLDALYAEAQEVLGQEADQLRALTARLRPTAASDARGRRLLSRLELAVWDVEQCRSFLERSPDTDQGGIQPEADALSGSTIELLASNVLEAQEEERTRIAEEIHDGPAQGLANASFQVEVIDRTLRDDPVAAATEVDTLRTLLARELDRLRGFVNQLRPSLLDDSGLDRALEESAQELSAEAGLNVEVLLEAPDTVLDGPERMVVLRVAQEAMRNARKHAGAQHVWLVTSYEPGSPAAAAGWIMEVRDDGRGFDVATAGFATDRHHFGLRFMRERATLVGGDLQIISEPGRGSLVRLTLDPRERSQKR